MEGYGYGTSNGKDNLQVMREEQFSHMEGQIYLDHAGATMYRADQIKQHSDALLRNMFANPHSSASPSSQRTVEIVDEIRHEIAAFFNTTLEEYDVVFTSGTTAGLKLIGETFPFTDRSLFVYSEDSHNSVVGVLPIEVLDSLPNNTTIKEEGTDSEVYNLFAFPGECNFSGAKHSLSIVSAVQSNAHKKMNLEKYCLGAKSVAPEGKWFVLLDAAKLAATNPIDFSRVKPDFVVVSFYKMFGYPTGLGTLLVKKSSGQCLKKAYFGGGTLSVSMSSLNISRPRPEIYRRFEDGTVSYLDILAVQYGLRILRNLSMRSIQRHVQSITYYMYAKLTELRHVNGSRVCVIYGNHHTSNYAGSIIALNFLRSDSSYVGYAEFSKLAGMHNIHVRTGCFCNPGACQAYLGLTTNQMLSHIDQGHVCGNTLDIIDGRPTGAIRLSFGYMTTKDEVDLFLSFVSTYFVSSTLASSFNSNKKLSTLPRSIRLSKISLFPIKSCGALNVHRWKIGSRGLLFDREWALIDPASGKVFRQKDMPQMTSIHPVIDLENQVLVVSSPLTSLAPLTISLSYVPTVSRALTVCSIPSEGGSYDDFVNKWFTCVLGRPCNLVRVIPDKVRPSGAKLRHNASGKSSIGFANEAQYLLISRESVEGLNSKLDEKVSDDVFRANIIVEGCSPHEEDNWQEIQIGDHNFSNVGPCGRCSMININQSTGEFSAAPLKELAAYRRNRANIFFGQFWNLSSSNSVLDLISVGDEVVVTKLDDSSLQTRTIM
ncbi:hypothetical protein Ae201684_005411 [Aphanomyces euteiches]|uniref:Molybdenum cofactor sulfurase n=1 Tax=Aphanomyces euteiches TaxID=100861 RepID=A0A6G0XF18_9STRA|nr:hypothetical protein Ae201684_005411 [Aphanomyces euteiches]